MRVVICGVGAIGSTSALLLRNLGAELALVDFDRVESKNLPAQAFTKSTLGKNKAEAMKMQLQSFWGLKAEAFPVRLTRDNVATLLAKADLVIDAFDNLESRQLLSAHCRAAQLPLVHGALSGDGTFAIVRWDERFAPDAEDHAGQATCEGGEHLPLIGLLAGALARVVQDFLQKQLRRDVMVSLQGVLTTAT